MTYRFYIADSLFAQGENKRLMKRYADIIKPQSTDDRSGDEIAEDVIRRLGLLKD